MPLIAGFYLKISVFAAALETLYQSTRSDHKALRVHRSAARKQRMLSVFAASRYDLLSAQEHRWWRHSSAWKCDRATDERIPSAKHCDAHAPELLRGSVCLLHALFL